MERISEWSKTASELQFMLDQVEKYNPGVCVFKRDRIGMYALYRADIGTK